MLNYRHLSAISALFNKSVVTIPGGDTTEDPDSEDDEESSHPSASVAGSQRLRDDVIALERDGEDREHGRVGHREFDKRHQSTYWKRGKQSV